MLIYCHGFSSSGQATKAQILRENFPAGSVLAPDLPYEPLSAVETIIKTARESIRKSEILLVGSSLGGFYALHLHQVLGWPALLLNPTVDPIGDTGRREQMESHFEEDALAAWRDEYTDQIRTLYHPAETIDSRNLFVFLNRNDELLDYKKAAAYFKVSNCRVTFSDTGGHRFENFITLIPTVRAIYDEIRRR